MTPTRPDFRPIDRSQHELLVVDDNPASRYATVRQLVSAGFRTREAANGAEALARADGGLSAVVLDVHLPDIDGFELCARFRSRPETARLAVLHLTAAFVTDDDKVRGLDGGADAYLTRPVEAAVLVATVQALVRTRIAEEAMRRSESKFRAIYAQAVGGIALLDAEGRLLDANPAMLAMLDRAHADVAGRPLADFAAPDSRACIERFAVCQDRPQSSIEAAIARPDGSILHLEWGISPHIEPGVTMALASDVSQRVQLEHQRQQLLDRERVARGEAEQVSRMKDDFIAVLSHELRTPLNAIMSWAHVLRQRGGSEETMRGLAAIARNGSTQARMISDLLDMSRLNTGKLPLALETLVPGDELRSAVSALSPSIDEQGIVVDLRIPDGLRAIRADAGRLQQVIWNLLSNAIKFSPRGGHVEMSLAEDGEGLRLAVADQGQGIAPEFLPFVFDRFAQSDAASNRTRGGLGLGLAIVKQLVEAHGGTVAARSPGRGLGATFEVWLPRDVVAPPPAAGPESEYASLEEAIDTSEAVLRGVNVLVVDDDMEANAMLSLILGDHGALVRSAADVRGALALLDAQRPDVLVSDIGMAGQDGYDLIRAVRAREQAPSAGAPGRRLPAIALTAFTRAQDRDQTLLAGFDAHCSKPLRPWSLLQQIRGLLDRPEAS